MDNTEKPIKYISFCAGYGGLELGVSSTGERLEPLAICEIEAYAVANTIAKMEAGQMEPAPLWTNLKTFPLEPFRGECDLLTGGFPCQPFSTARARAGDEDPRHLFPYFIRAIKGIRPRRVFLENVAGLLSAKLKGSHWADPEGTPVLLHVLRELERVGYRAEAGIFSAREAGAPHLRKRVFILAKLANEFGIGCGGRESAPDTLNEQGVQVREGEQTRAHFRGEVTGRGGAPRERDLKDLADPSDMLSDGGDDNGGERHGCEALPELGDGCGAGVFHQWPARPSELQGEWEEPRVVGHTERRGRESRAHGGPSAEVARAGRSTGARGDERGAPQAQAEPELGGATYGPPGRVDPTAHRVDRLRMCGNGVVPQTAAIAWKELNNRLNNDPRKG